MYYRMCVCDAHTILIYSDVVVTIHVIYSVSRCLYIWRPFPQHVAVLNHADRSDTHRAALLAFFWRNSVKLLTFFEVGGGVFFCCCCRVCRSPELAFRAEVPSPRGP